MILLNARGWVGYREEGDRESAEEEREGSSVD